MTTMSDILDRHVKSIMTNAVFYNQRTGQYIFNHLPDDCANLVRSTLFDPFYKSFNRVEVRQWMEDHLIFDDRGNIIGLFNNNSILWEMGNE